MKLALVIDKKIQEIEALSHLRILNTWRKKDDVKAVKLYNR